MELSDLLLLYALMTLTIGFLLLLIQGEILIFKILWLDHRDKLRLSFLIFFDLLAGLTLVPNDLSLFLAIVSCPARIYLLKIRMQSLINCWLLRCLWCNNKGSRGRLLFSMGFLKFVLFVLKDFHFATELLEAHFNGTVPGFLGFRHGESFHLTPYLFQLSVPNWNRVVQNNRCKVWWS